MIELGPGSIPFPPAPVPEPMVSSRAASVEAAGLADVRVGGEVELRIAELGHRAVIFGNSLPEEKSDAIAALVEISRRTPEPGRTAGLSAESVAVIAEAVLSEGNPQSVRIEALAALHEVTRNLPDKVAENIARALSDRADPRSRDVGSSLESPPSRAAELVGAILDGSHRDVTRRLSDISELSQVAFITAVSATAAILRSDKEFVIGDLRMMADGLEALLAMNSTLAADVSQVLRSSLPEGSRARGIADNIVRIWAGSRDELAGAIE